jgi:glycosyltransferase involved in cell wall biosynthesis
VKALSLVTIEREDPDADVLMLTTAWPNGENATYGIPVRRQVDALVQCGVRCDVVYVRGYRSVFAYPLGTFRLALWALTGRRRYRVVHAHGGEAALVATFYRRAALLVTYLGSDVLGAPRADGPVPWQWRIRRSIIRQHGRLAARTITESSEMESVLPAPVRARNTVLPKGVDTKLFNELDQAESRRRLGWSQEKRIALFAAVPGAPLKRFGLAEAAVERARVQVPDIELQVASNIDPDRMPVLMSAADCLLHTSASEGSPNVVKEALMCNLPVVATPAGDIEELLAEVSPAYLCEPSPDSLAEALVDCLREPRRSDGRKRAARLDQAAASSSILRIYEQLGEQ